MAPADSTGRFLNELLLGSDNRKLDQGGPRGPMREIRPGLIQFSARLRAIKAEIEEISVAASRLAPSRHVTESRLAICAGCLSGKERPSRRSSSNTASRAPIT